MKNLCDQLKQIAEPINRGEKINEVIGRVAKRVKVVGLNGDPQSMSFSRVYEIWYGRAKRIDQREIDAIEAAKDKRLREIARNELHDIKSRLALLESRLAQTDADFHRETIDALGSLSSGLGGLAHGRG